MIIDDLWNRWNWPSPGDGDRFPGGRVAKNRKKLPSTVTNRADLHDKFQRCNKSHHSPQRLWVTDVTFSWVSPGDKNVARNSVQEVATRQLHSRFIAGVKLDVCGHLITVLGSRGKTSATRQGQASKSGFGFPRMNCVEIVDIFRQQTAGRVRESLFNATDTLKSAGFKSIV